MMIMIVDFCNKKFTLLKLTEYVVPKSMKIYIIEELTKKGIQ